jgi:hypothetical protein
MNAHSLLPTSLEDIDTRNPDLQSLELSRLKTLYDAGLLVAPMRVVPGALEEHFYRLNNLPEQLGKLFKGVNLKRPDEDDLEDLAPQAQALIKRHFILDEIIDMIYSSIAALPQHLVIRRPGQQGLTALNGRPTLIAIKDIWMQTWSFENLQERLDKTPTIAIAEQPVIIQSSGSSASPTLSQQASQILGQKVTVEALETGITRVMYDIR